MKNKLVVIAIVCLLAAASATIIASHTKITPSASSTLTFNCDGSGDLQAYDDAPWNDGQPISCGKYNEYWFWMDSKYVVNKITLTVYDESTMDKGCITNTATVGLTLYYYIPGIGYDYDFQTGRKTISGELNTFTFDNINAEGQWLCIRIDDFNSVCDAHYMTVCEGTIYHSGEVPKTGEASIHSFDPVRSLDSYESDGRTTLCRGTVYNVGDYQSAIQMRLVLNPNTPNEKILDSVTMGLNPYPEWGSSWDFVASASNSNLPSSPAVLSLGIKFWAGDYGDYNDVPWSDSERARMWTCLVGDPSNYISVNMVSPDNGEGGVETPTELKVHVSTDFYNPYVKFTLEGDTVEEYTVYMSKKEQDVSHTFNTAPDNEYLWYVTVYSEQDIKYTNSENPWAFDTNTLNVPPVASANGPYIVTDTNPYITLDASGSYDPDGSIVSWKWEEWNGDYWQYITDKETYETRCFSVYPNGSYRIRVVVTDNSGLTSTDETRVYVNTPFPQENYTLTTNVVGEGYIDINPDKDAYSPGTEVTLTAVPYAGWAFSEWTGDVSSSYITIYTVNNPLTITMDRDRDITAVFTKPETYTLTVRCDPPGSGTVQADPSGGSYTEETSVTLTASPEPGYRFTEWTGDASGTDQTITITMNSDMTVTAHFEKTTTHMWWLPFLIAIGLIAVAGCVYYKNKKW